MTEPIIGIDLGTTNSEVAIIENGNAVVIKDANGQSMLPSFVGLSPTDELLIGETARNQYHVYPERTIKSIKRRMGSSEQVQIAEQSYTPQEISAMILRQLKTNAENYLGQSVNQAVITVPAYFNDAQRQATLEAGQIAGLDVVRLINEPTAAALSYDAGFDGQKQVLICDLGGGTLDISIVKIQNGIVEVLASHGKTDLGGDDFDAVLLKLMYQQISQHNNIDIQRLENDLTITSRLWRAAHDAKLKLSTQPFVQIDEEFLLSDNGVPFNLSFELSREQYEEAITPLVYNILDTVQTALKSADLKLTEIDEMLLVGGATRTPIVRQMMAAETGLEPKNGLHPDLSVAIGAAIQAGMIAGKSVASVLVDITPYSYGTRIIGELDGMPYPALFYPVIKRNTPIPATRSELFFTAEDKQTFVDLKIYQGEDENALNNTLIGEFKIEGLRKVHFKNAVIVEFCLDRNGILTVKATEKDTGLSKSITIENACPRLDTSQIDQAQKKIDQLVGEESTAPTMPYEKLIQRVEIARLQATTVDIKTMNSLLDSIQSAHIEKNENAYIHAKQELENILYYLES